MTASALGTPTRHGALICRVRRRRHFTFRQCRPSTSASNAVEKEQPPPPLVRVASARLAYPDPDPTSTCNSRTAPLSLSVHPPNAEWGGGHAVLGRNGSGKSLLHLALSHGTSIGGPDQSHVESGDISFPHDPNVDRYKSRYPVSSVSFDSHRSLLRNGGTGYAALTPLGGRLSKAAEYLVVRFGLFPLLGRDVSTLSTGEIRKVLLVRALSTRPKLLLLDNAFDGLDVPSRESLSDLVSKMLRGFRTDILVQGVDARNAARTQVLMSTHRAEEIVDEIGTISWLGRQAGGIATEKRMGRSGARLMRSVRDDWTSCGNDGFSIGDEEEAEQDVARLIEAKTGETHQAADRHTWGGAASGAWDDPDMPSLDEIASLMQRDSSKVTSRSETSPAVQTENMSIVKGDHRLISDLTWTVAQGDRWLIAGGNGQGKSTLSRLLVQSRNDVAGGSLSVSIDKDSIGWVSTELHMSLASSSCSTRDVLSGLDTDGHNALAEPSPLDIGETVCSWLNIDDALLSRPFSRLSQGEQKMILIARAFASRPRLLIVDEPMQGLDWHNRRRVLGLIERFCRATDATLIYITHHLEELLPCVTHVLHLREGRAVYQGGLESYNPEQL